MRTLIFAVLASSLPAIGLAQSQPPMQTEAPTESVVVRAPQLIELPVRRNNFWGDEYEAVRGQYVLSNGQNMTLSLEAQKMYATIDGMGKRQIVAESPFVFVSTDRQLKISVMDPSKPAGPVDANVLMQLPTDQYVVLNGRAMKRVARR